MKRTLSLFVLVFLLMSLLYGRIMIDGDGLTYYALARSLVEDHDFDLRNQRQQVPDLHLTIHPVTRRIAAHFSFGFGILYAPFLYVSEKIANYFPPFANWKPYFQNRILPFPHTFAIFIGSLIYGIFTWILCYFSLIGKNRQTSLKAILTTTVIFVGTPLIFYVFTMPSYSHASDAFLVTAAFYLTFTARSMKAGPIFVRNLLLGSVLALSVLLRNNNIVLLFPIVIGSLFRNVKLESRKALVVLLEIFFGAVPFILLLANFNLSQYGELFTTGYRVQWEEQFLAEMLFHPDAGLFIWTPITLLSLTGMIAGCIKRQIESVIALLCVLAVLFSVQFQPNWWGGCSFGPRFFTHLFVFWAWGLMECWNLIRKPILIIAVLICAGWTFFLFNLFFINATSTEFRIMLRTNKCRRSPANMIHSAASEYSSAKEKNETGNPIGFWFQSLGKGRFPTVQSLFYRQVPEQE